MPKRLVAKSKPGLVSALVTVKQNGTGVVVAVVDRKGAVIKGGKLAHISTKGIKRIPGVNPNLGIALSARGNGMVRFYRD